jgi:serine/threonine protein kinase
VCCVGELIGGRYRVGTPLDPYASCPAWRARDEGGGADVVALRVEDTAASRRVVHEARLVATSLRHPGIVPVLDALSHADHAWLVAEPVRGETLAAAGRQDEATVVRIARAVADAMAVLHARFLALLYLTPADIEVTDGGARIIWPPLSRLVHPAPLHRIDVAAEDWHYLAPEVLRGAIGLGPADVYAFGATLYTAVEGAGPYVRETPVESARAVLAGSPRTPAIASPALASLLLRMLDPQPGSRASLADVHEALRRLDRRRDDPR